MKLGMAVIIGLQAVILYRLFTQSNDKDVMKQASQSIGQSHFGGVLYTDDDILELARAWRRNSSLFVGDPDDVSKDYGGDICYVELLKLTHTPCCSISTRLVTAPPIATDVDDVARHITKFADQSQFFYTEFCMATDSVCNCRCTQSKDLLVSLVYTDAGNWWWNTYGIATFKLGNLCKSLNN